MRNLLLLVLFVPFLLFSQKLSVSGKVMYNNEAITGVTVLEKGTFNGTTTDLDGNYSIKVNNDATLIFSFISFKSKELKVNKRQIINVTLEEDASKLDEVIIKGFTGVVGQARRRAESIQNIPESVVTYTSKAIETKGITNIKSFADQIPNVNFTSSQNVGNNFITVRGISHIRNGESPIAFVIDGVTLPDANLLNQELFDLALIEIVKGPQGALYGKNAIAGAINITTKQPTNKFSNKVSLGYGRGNMFKAQVSSTGPISKDKLFYRISGSYKKGDGLITNKTLNKTVDFIEDLTFRGQLKAKISTGFNATLTGQIIDAKGGAAYYAKPITGTNFAPDDFNNQEVLSDQFGESSLKGFYGNLKLNYKFNDLKLISSTTYNEGDRSHVGDLDYTSADVLRQIQNSNSKTFNQEIKLSSKDDGKLTWDIGTFYQKTDKLLFTQATADFGFFAPPFTPSGTQSILATSDFTNTYSTFAAFGFLDYKISDRFTVSAGLRYDNDNISQDNRTLNKKPSKTDSQLQPKVSLALKATENMLMYANYGRGYRSGGFNQDSTVRFKSDFDAEITDNYELGIKNNYWNNRFILNLSTYYIDFKNQQLYALLIDGRAGNILIGNFNVPKSKSYGFEADFKLRAANYLDILASYGVSKSMIIEGKSTVSTGSNEEINISGKNTPLIPQDSYTFGLESNFDISNNLAFNGNITLKGTGEIYWHEDNKDVSSSYNLLNARFGFTINKNTSINLWGSNLLNKKYITEFFGQTFSNGGSDLVWKGQPLSFGVDLSYKF